MRIIHLCVVLFFSGFVYAEPVVVKYIGLNVGIKEDYYIEMINAALSVTEPTDGSFKVVFTEEKFVALRKQTFLVAGDLVNIDRMVETPENLPLRKSLIRVNHPLLQGFGAYRILLIRNGEQSRFNDINSLADLRRFTMGFGRGWEGYVYEDAGIKVEEVGTFETLLKMLAGGRFDYIPLNSAEINDKYVAKNKPNELVPEKNLVLYTAVPIYFFVSQKAPEVARRLEIGLQKIESDGTEDAIFLKHYGQRLKHINFSKRKLILVKNTDERDSDILKKFHKDILRFQ